MANVPCRTAKTMRFRVYEKCSDITHADLPSATRQAPMHDTGKEFSVSLKDSEDWFIKNGCRGTGRIDENYILITMLNTLYGFEGTRGHCLTWDVRQEYIRGFVEWRGSVWEIRRVI